MYVYIYIPSKNLINSRDSAYWRDSNIETARSRHKILRRALQAARRGGPRDVNRARKSEREPVRAGSGPWESRKGAIEESEENFHGEGGGIHPNGRVSLKFAGDIAVRRIGVGGEGGEKKTDTRRKTAGKRETRNERENEKRKNVKENKGAFSINVAIRERLT